MKKLNKLSLKSWLGKYKLYIFCSFKVFPISKYLSGCTMKSKTVLITGASSGIGEAFAYECANKGAHLVLVARSQAGLAEVSKKIKEKYQVQVSLIAMDLSVEGAAQELFQKTKDKGLDVDILINNAGFGKWGNFEDFDLLTYKRMLQLNISTLTELCYLYLDGMKSKRSGGIINVASGAALMPVPYAGVYSASKSYVLNFSEALYNELEGTGITVTCLCPSGTKTNFAAVANNDVSVDEKQYETAEHVAKVGLHGFLANRSYVLSGKQKVLLSILPRILSRAKLLKLSGDVFKKIVDNKKTEIVKGH
ncbi:SDR family NAD(P)-dependent oxidoreductase [Microbulbifer sp. ZKSA004]|uniref:SDR family NAD(P)-dependent oxidoreductase n=1 Tax=Microbulbifer sp. ZKSA004 TaxID=3243389 RepID=UPI00403A27E0